MLLFKTMLAPKAESISTAWEMGLWLEVTWQGGHVFRFFPK